MIDEGFGVVEQSLCARVLLLGLDFAGEKAVVLRGF